MKGARRRSGEGQETDEGDGSTFEGATSQKRLIAALETRRSRRRTWRSCCCEAQAEEMENVRGEVLRDVSGREAGRAKRVVLNTPSGSEDVRRASRRI